MNYFKLMKENPALFENRENAPLQIIKNKEQIKAWEKKQKNSLREQGLPETWAEIGVVYEDPHICIFRDLVRFPSGNLNGYFRIMNTADLKGGQGSVILPLFEEKIILLRQFRHSTRQWHWELPRGFGVPHLSAEENAHKEIREEVEGEISELIDLGTYHSNTGIEANKVRLYAARLKSIGKTNREEGIQSFRLVSVAELQDMIRLEKVTDGFTIAAYTRANLKRIF